MNRLYKILTTGLVLPILLMTVSPVMAESGSGSTGSTSNSGTDTTSSTDESKLTPEQLAQKAAELKKRLEDNKAKLKSKLDEAAKKRISNKCKAAQGVVKGAETSADSINTNRKKAYSKITDAVQKLVDRLKAQGKDTTEVESALVTAKQKAEALSSAMTTYQQTLSDLRSMDCVADPTAFAATLDTARTQREAVKTAATDLRTYLSVTLKGAVNKLKNQLENEKKSESASDSSNGGSN